MSSSEPRRQSARSLRSRLSEQTLPAVGLLAACIVVWVLVEVVSCAAIYTYLFITGSGRAPEEQQDRLARIVPPYNHPLWSGFPEDVNPQTFDPFLGHRYPAASNVGDGLETDRYGFIHNGDPDRVLSAGDDTVRIVVLGGSSVAGVGVHDNRSTIASILEARLNERPDGNTYEVINAGVGGYYSPIEAVYFLIELVHYRPTIILALDGFNDFWHSFVPAADSADDGDWALPNRSRYQQGVLVQNLTGWRPRRRRDVLLPPSLASRCFYYTGLLLHRVLDRVYPVDPPQPPLLAFSMDPWRNNARWIRDEVYRSPSHTVFLNENWLSLVGMARIRGILVGIFLQPMFPISKHRLTDDEQGKIDEFFEWRPRIDREDYATQAWSWHSASHEVVLALSRTFEKDKQVHVEDLSGLFDDETEAVFSDVVHYTRKGNKLLARHFEEVIRELLGSRSSFPE